MQRRKELFDGLDASLNLDDLETLPFVFYVAYFSDEGQR